ncbi:DUF4393 domain-containing protein [Peribacillus loiseleuriae]|uniref:DUF4393 domain-containing protein n=1 Tax=Peribacillus loiseleuriae TaxID=1679170 RepID=UPI0006709A36|nr:DUF4393 domain-containing protein [Peribacillus loiseleuriae]
MNFFPKFIDEAMSPVAQSVGTTISNLWQLGLGSHVDFWTQKQSIRQSNALETYRIQIENKITEIPEDNLVEPQLHIVGPALEASKYYVQNEDLRNMFANLIASSMDITKIEQAHPSFVEIIKQMSPLDAKNLKLFFDNVMHPIVNYKLTNSKLAENIIKTDVFLGNHEVNDIDLNAASLTNLSRLGLITIKYEQYINDETTYEKFKNTDLYLSINDLFNTSSHLNDPFLRNYERIVIQKGVIVTTPYGKNFIKTCVDRF